MIIIPAIFRELSVLDLLQRGSEILINAQPFSFKRMAGRMKSSNLAVIGVIAVMLFISSFSVLISVGPVSAQEDGEIIVQGKATAKSVNKQSPLPENMYEEGDYPPLIVAERIGSGAVVAGGIASGCRDGSWNDPDNPLPHLDVFFDVAFQWMAPGATQVLWYEGYGVYNTATVCAQFIEALENLGYSVTPDTTEPITSILLAPYDILVIPQLELATADQLPAADALAIKDFVEGGKGLFIMDQSDAFFNFYEVHNKILRRLGFDYRFQHDQVEDDVNNWGGESFQLIADVDAATPIGSDYQDRTGSTEIGLYSVCSLTLPAAVAEYEVSVKAIPETYEQVIWPGEPLRRGGGRSGRPGHTIVFPINVVNDGVSNDTYTITVEDELGWSSPPPVSTVSLASGENRMFELEVNVPSDLAERTCDSIIVKATGASGAEDNVLLRAVGYVSVGAPPYPTVEFSPGDVYYWFSTPTLCVEPPAVPIICGSESGFGAELTPREPWPCLYLTLEYPPTAAVALVGDGRVAAVGGVGSLRSSPANYIEQDVLGAKKLMPKIVQWLIKRNDPRGRKFLFYVFPGAFNDQANLSVWLDWVEDDFGFDLTVQVGGTITAELLEDYDVLHLADQEQKYPETDQSLNDNELQAIVDWVQNGGGLLVMGQADYSAWADPEYGNPIFEALGVPIRFQDDELYDTVSWTVDGPWFPKIYVLDPSEGDLESELNVWFGPSVSVSASPESGTGDNEILSSTLTIMNEGYEDTTYLIEATTNLGWEVTLSQSEVPLASGGSTEVTFTVVVPDVAPGDVEGPEKVTVKVIDNGYPWIFSSAEYTVVGSGTGEEPSEEEGLPLTIIAGVIGAIVVIAIVSYFVMKRG